MSGQFGLDTAGLTLSLFNMILLVWLGLTVLFNAERRTWGMYLAVGGLLAGGVFFLCHSVILSLGANSLIQDFRFWWYAGWLPLVLAPYTWSLLMLWYSGYWDDRTGDLHRRLKPWLWFSFIYTILLIVLLLSVNPLPNREILAHPEAESLLSVGNIPPVVLAYPLYLLLCIGLALDALLRPTPSGRVMGDLARRRARPWMVGVTLVLLTVSLIVGAIIIWLVPAARTLPGISELLFAHPAELSILDLIITALLSIALLLLGQAVVTYEIFTGKTLPRQGFKRQWRDIILLTSGLSFLSAIGHTAHLPPIYSLLGVLLLIAFSYALFSRMSLTEREQSMHQLRPFTSNQRLFDRILNPSPNSPLELELADLFRAVCQDVLGTQRALLLPQGSLAALGLPPLRYPQDEGVELPAYTHLLERFTSPQMNGLALNPDRFGGFIWVAPLWSERGLNGLLFFGEKSDGGFHSLEEIELARASGERLADLLASAEIARRLIVLQRQRLVESAVLDRRARRVLHDDVLPRLHTALLSLENKGGSGSTDGADVLAILTSAHLQISDILRDLPRPLTPELDRLGLVGALRKVIDSELPDSFDRVNWQIDPRVETHIQDLSPLVAEVLFFAAREAVRNAAQHARTPGEHHPLHLKVCIAWRDGLELQIEDNGVGIASVNRGHPSGGQGLSLHSTMMAVINGSLALDSVPGEFTRLTLYLPESALQVWDADEGDSWNNSRGA